MSQPTTAASTCASAGIPGMDCNNNPGLILTPNVVPTYVSYGDPVYLMYYDSGKSYPVTGYGNATASQNLTTSDATFYSAGNYAPIVWTLVAYNYSSDNLTSTMPCGGGLIQSGFYFYLFTYYDSSLIVEWNPTKPVEASLSDLNSYNGINLWQGALQLELTNISSNYVYYGTQGTFNVRVPSTSAYWFSYASGSNYIIGESIVTAAEASNFYFLYAGDPSIIAMQCCAGAGTIPASFCGDYYKTSTGAPDVCQTVINNYCKRANQADVNCACNLPESYWTKIGIQQQDALCIFSPCIDNYATAYMTQDQMGFISNCDITVCEINYTGVTTNNVNKITITNNCPVGSEGATTNGATTSTQTGSGATGNNPSNPSGIGGKWKALTLEQKAKDITIATIIGVILLVMFVVIAIIIMICIVYSK